MTGTADDDITHNGISTGWYQRGCRCDRCKEANRERHRRTVAGMRQRAREFPERVPHGTVSGYRNHGCHCGRCREANREKARKSRRDARERAKASGRDTGAEEEKATGARLARRFSVSPLAAKSRESRCGRLPGCY